MVLLLFLFLVCIRAFEKYLFYDPFIHYFKGAYLQVPAPEIETFRLLCHLVLRYVLNSFISIAIIGLVFQKKSTLKFSAYCYGIAFFIFGSLFFILVLSDLKSGYLLFFYVRRFLVHPLILIVLLPILYYQRQLD